MAVLQYCHFALPDEWMDPGRDHQWWETPSMGKWPAFCAFWWKFIVSPTAVLPKKKKREMCTGWCLHELILDEGTGNAGCKQNPDCGKFYGTNDPVS